MVHIACSTAIVSKGECNKGMYAYHHGVCLATAGDSICKYGTIDAIYGGLDHPFTCAGVDLHRSQELL